TTQSALSLSSVTSEAVNRPSSASVASVGGVSAKADSARCLAHNAPAARVGLEIAMLVQKIRDLRLDRLRQQGAGPAAQNPGERIEEGPWLRELDDVIVGHGVSLLQWRSGGVEYPHDTPPYPFMPSPTSALSWSMDRSDRTSSTQNET